MGFCLGWILSSRQNLKTRVENEGMDLFARKNNVHPTMKKNIKIDDAKFVTDVSTTMLKRNNLELGKKTSVDDDITSSVDRLAQLKKLK